MATTVLKIDLSPQELDLVLYSGDGAQFRLIAKDKEDNPVDLSGTMIAQIRSKRGEFGDPIATFDVDLSNADNGIAVLSLSGQATRELASTRKFVGFWDVQWTPEGSEPKTLCQGKVECDVDVSR